MLPRYQNAFKRSSFGIYRYIYDGPAAADIVKFPKDARVVICGGGVMGASVAYHLAKLGWGKDTVVVEQSRIGGGTTWHSSGLIGVFKPSLVQVNLTKSSVALYKELESKGLSTGWKQSGSLNVARTRDRMTVFRRMKAQSVSWQIDCELLTPDQCKDKWPLLNTDDILGGLWIPGDGVGDPYETCLSIMAEAKNMGVQVFENCGVRKINHINNRVSGVKTDLGNINCEYFVNCAGFWARGVGQLSEPYVKVPLHAVEHYYLHTKPIPALDSMLPEWPEENETKPLSGTSSSFKKIYTTQPAFSEDLRKRIVEESHRIISKTLRNVQDRFKQKIYYCMDTGGHQFEH